MTCIAALVNDDHIYMGGDSAMSCGSVVQTLAQKKVFRLGDFLIGYSGTVRMLQLLQFAFTPPEHPTDMGIERYFSTTFVDEMRRVLKDAGTAGKQNEQETSTGDCLVGYRGRLFHIDYCYGFAEATDDFNAIGSGNQVALGALHATQHMSLMPQKRIELALTAASELCNGVHGPFIIEEL